MAFGIRKAMGALAIMALVAAIPLGVGCGGGGDDGSERAVKWGVDRPVGPNWVRIRAVIEVCVKSVQLEEPIIDYEDDRVYIELRHTPEEGEGEHSGCFLSLLILHKTITLERNLDELVLFDASTDPPEKRWPPERRWPTE